jgi:predicted kinase
MNNDIISELADLYFQSRPNKDRHNGKLAVLFLACSGAGKSTIRQKVVEELGATYVCNDEVRQILNDRGLPMTYLKPVVDKTWQQLHEETSNGFIVFDSNLSSYYMHEDSYSNTAVKLGYMRYVIALDLSEEELVKRIRKRERSDTEDVLSLLPEQLIAQHKAMLVLRPDYVIEIQSNYDELIGVLQVAASETNNT